MVLIRPFYDTHSALTRKVPVYGASLRLFKIVLPDDFFSHRAYLRTNILILKVSSNLRR
jgi:hypothetical protein